jgi:hypothetical protein
MKKQFLPHALGQKGDQTVQSSKTQLQVCK